MGILIDDIEAEPTAVAVEIEFVVAILTHQLCGVKRGIERETEIAHTQAECRFEVGLHL